MYTEIEPITIVYTKNNMTFYDLAVDILAIAGGSVATIGVLNAFYHFLFKSH
jgi:predicted RNA-binding protein associated with RNAse of E/G family